MTDKQFPYRYPGSDTVEQLAKLLGELRPPFVPIEIPALDRLIGFVWLPAGDWTDYVTEELHVHRIFWRFGIVVLEL